MKWGTRKAPSSSPPHVSSDHVVAEGHKTVVKQHGLKALSNDDLRKLNERMQLEQSHRDLSGKAPSGFKSGHQHVKTILSVAKTLNDIHNTVNGPVGKAVKAAAKAKKG
jgi:hypothetical protein